MDLNSRIRIPTCALRLLELRLSNSHISSASDTKTQWSPDTQKRTAYLSSKHYVPSHNYGCCCLALHIVMIVVGDACSAYLEPEALNPKPMIFDNRIALPFRGPGKGVASSASSWVNYLDQLARNPPPPTHTHTHAQHYDQK